MAKLLICQMALHILLIVKPAAIQAYTIGNNILALQFHLEVTPEIVKDMVKHEGHELIDASYIHSADKILSELNYLERNKEILFGLLDGFFGE